MTRREVRGERKATPTRLFYQESKALGDLLKALEHPQNHRGELGVNRELEYDENSGYFLRIEVTLREIIRLLGGRIHNGRSFGQ